MGLNENKKNAIGVKDIVEISLMLTLLIILSQIAIPLGVAPITLQTLGVIIIGGLVKIKKAAITIIIYILMGLIGLPVFAKFSSGIGVLLGPTAGYIYAFLPAVIIISILSGIIFSKFVDKNGNERSKQIYLLLFLVNFFVGEILILCLGSIWLSQYLDMGYLSALKLNLIYVPGGIFKAVIGMLVVVKVRKYNLDK